MKGTKDRLRAFLRVHRVATVAIVTPDHRPHAAALFYAVDDQLRLYALTDPATQHGQAMLTAQWVAGTVQRDDQQWHEVQGVQFRGPCRQAVGRERDRAWRCYVERYPFLLLENQVLSAALAKTALWVIEPEWMRLIDNRLGFGHKEEWHRHPRRKS